MDDTNKNNMMKYAAGALIIIIIAGVLFFGLNGSTSPAVTTVANNGGTTTALSNSSASGSGNNMSIQLTDPPIVPSGTQSLTVTYSGVDLHEAGASNSTGFVNYSASGTINLMNLTNVSQTIAVIKVSANQSFNLIRFDIKSATITINNVTYNVTVATGGVIARINSTVNSTSSGGVLIDLSPTVLQVYTSSNQSIFILVPSARAVVIGKKLVNANGNIGLHVGEKAPLQANISTALWNLRPNLTITSASASEAGNVTEFHITVKNNGNSSVRISDVAVSGFFEAVPTLGTWNPPSQFNGTINIGASASGRRNGEDKMGGGASATVGIGAGASASGNGFWNNGRYINTSTNASGSFQVGPTMILNSSLNSSIMADMHAGQGIFGNPGAASGPVALGVSEAEIFNRNFHNQLNFIIDSNGTLQLPYFFAAAACPAIIVSHGNASASAQGCGNNSFGYSLGPGASVNLTFDGVITMPNVGVVVSPEVGIESGASGNANWVGPRVNSAEVVLIPNQTYGISVHGEKGASVSTKVNATGYVKSFSSNLVDVTNVDLTLQNSSSGIAHNETMAGFISHSNSTVSYTVFSFGGPFSVALPRLGSYGLNVTGFQVNTAGFTLINYSTASRNPPCPVCAPEKACPMYACVGGTGYIYLLSIKMPSTNYTGTLSITEDYKPLAATVNATVNATT